MLSTTPTSSSSSLSFSTVSPMIVLSDSAPTTTIQPLPPTIATTNPTMMMPTAMPPITPLPPSEIMLLQAPAAPFQPSNQDKINYSHLTGNSYASSVYETNDKFGGFCAYNQQNPTQIETICNGLDKNVCSSTQCCVLVGGEKCVAGNEHGPTNYSNYSDPMVLHRDLYYYQGKCYGNCQNALVNDATSFQASVAPSTSYSSSTSTTTLTLPAAAVISAASPPFSQVQAVQTVQTQAPISSDTTSSSSIPLRTRRPAARFTGKVATKRPSTYTYP